MQSHIVTPEDGMVTPREAAQIGKELEEKVSMLGSLTGTETGSDLVPLPSGFYNDKYKHRKKKETLPKAVPTSCCASFFRMLSSCCSSGYEPIEKEKVRPAR